MKKLLLGMVLLSCVVFAGCAYDTPVFVPIDTSETAFVIKLEGDSKQGSLKSEEMLGKNMVATKRIQVSYRWITLGRGWVNGEYLPNERVVVVDRAPETREWVSSSSKGTSKNDQGIWVESSDSVGFTTGISITARVANEADAVKFLYNYPPKRERVIEISNAYKKDYSVDVSDLADIMDQEVRTKIQSVFAEEAAEYNMDDLRDKKNEIIGEIRLKVIPFFAERGITITAIGLFGGFNYENPEIQKSIDKVFQGQQDEEVAKAEAKAAEQRKEALRLKGEGIAQQKIAEAEGLKEAAIAQAEGEAEAIKKVADAKAYELEKLSQNPEAYMSLKQLEIEMMRLEVWDGKYPIYYLGGKQEGLNMFLPSPSPQK